MKLSISHKSSVSLLAKIMDFILHLKKITIYDRIHHEKEEPFLFDLASFKPPLLIRDDIFWKKE
jgi:hemerythrin-like domain-containing protein